MKKLYQIEIRYDILVLAGDENEAQEIAEEFGSEEFNSDPPSKMGLPLEISKLNECPSNWLGAIPYGFPCWAVSHKTCEELLSEDKHF